MLKSQIPLNNLSNYSNNTISSTKNNNNNNGDFETKQQQKNVENNLGLRRKHFSIIN